MITKRCVIYPKDIQVMTGRSLKYAQTVCTKIKKIYNKRRSQYITIEEFAEFSGIPVELIAEYMY